MLRTRLHTKQTSNHAFFLALSSTSTTEQRRVGVWGRGRSDCWDPRVCSHKYPLLTLSKATSLGVSERRRKTLVLYSLFQGLCSHGFHCPIALPFFFRITHHPSGLNSIVQKVFPDFMTMLTAPFAAPTDSCTTLHPGTYHTALYLAIDLSIRLLVSSMRTGLMGNLNRCVQCKNGPY